MPLRRPSRSDIMSSSDACHLQITESELNDFHDLVCENLDLYDELEQYPDNQRDVIPAIRIPLNRPDPKDDPLNAIVRYCSVYTDKKGVLAGKRIGIKDTVCIAGMPMSCASRLLYGFTPDIDATIVTRMLEAGAHITAILNTDDFAFSGGGHTSAYGLTKNPANPKHTAGGSSCGSAAAVGSGLVDIAIGGDQGGSIRIPSSWSGTVGLKPSHGLVPYTGIVGFDLTIDHIGPMTTNVADAALMLSVLAGVDGDDPRQPPTVPVQDYQKALTGDIKGLKIAVIKEGFGSKYSMKEVDKSVRDAIKRLKKLGAIIQEISVPEHLMVSPVWNAVACEGGFNSFYSGHHAYQHKGWYYPNLMSSMRRGIKTNGGDFSPTAKMGILVADYMNKQYNGVFYGRARNLSNKIFAAYEKVFSQFDIVVMPTTPQTAMEIPDSPEVDRKTYIRNALNMCANTAAFDLTGHPSISIPCKINSGLPVGLMLTGRRFDDASVLKIAHAYENIST